MTLLNRYFKICSSYSTFYLELEKFEEKFLLNGNPSGPQSPYVKKVSMASVVVIFSPKSGAVRNSQPIYVITSSMRVSSCERFVVRGLWVCITVLCVGVRGCRLCRSPTFVGVGLLFSRLF